MEAMCTQQYDYPVPLSLTKQILGVYILVNILISRGGAILFTHDMCRRIKCDTHIGKKCFVGANAIIMCGVTVGDEVVIGSGAIVTKDVPSNCIVAGNPAKIIREGIHTDNYGKIINYERTE